MYQSATGLANLVPTKAFFQFFGLQVHIPGTQVIFGILFQITTGFAG